jgi:hypothetical protein
MSACLPIAIDDAPLAEAGELGRNAVTHYTGEKTFHVLMRPVRELATPARGGVEPTRIGGREPRPLETGPDRIRRESDELEG